MTTAVWLASHRASVLTNPLSSTANGAGVAIGGLDGLGGSTDGGGGPAAMVVSGRAVGGETVAGAAHLTTAPTETISVASKTADPPSARRLRSSSRPGGGCLRCRPRVRGGRVIYPELVTKVAPVKQLRALIVRNILHDNACRKTRSHPALRRRESC